MRTMKKLSIVLLAFVTLVGFNACTSDDDVVFIANPDAEGIHFTNTFASTYDLTEMEPGDVVDRFVWNEVDFEVSTNINYEVQGALTEGFEKPETLGSTSINNLDITAQQLIKLVAETELDENDMTTVYVRVVASPGTAGEMAHISEVESFTIVVPTEPEYINLYMVGDATAAGWNPDNNNTPLFRDAENANIYYYTGKLNAGALKFVETTGWAPQYGSSEEGVLTYRETEADPDPAGITIPAEGYYTVVVNTKDLTYTLEPAPDAADKKTYEMIGLVGAGTTVGWPGDDNPTPDILLTKSAFNPHIWFTEDVVLSEAGIKFRANQDWSVSWGGGVNFPSGLATGDDIIVSKAGTYNVWFNDVTGRYIFIEQEAAE